MTLTVRFKLTHENGRAPTRAHESDAGYDLYAAEVTTDEATGNIVVHFGIAVEIPEGHVGLLFCRSSVSETNYILRNHVGVIDSGYRGPVTAKFGVLDTCTALRQFRPLDRVAQLMVLPVPSLTFVCVSELSDSDRGTGGYGSTGNK